MPLPRSHAKNAPASTTCCSTMASDGQSGGGSVIDMVRGAIDRQSVALAFQPVVDASVSDTTMFYEGLIRVMDETGKVIPAGAFIEEVEPLDLGRQIDVIALSLGLDALRSDRDLKLSINLSALTVGHVPWLTTLETAIGDEPDLGHRLILEITESAAVMYPEQLADFMQKLHARGITFAIDDFGSGYTSMRYLKDLYFDILKIDGSFTDGVNSDFDNRAMIDAIISIGRHFDMVTVAERVETAEEAQTLTDAGIKCLQGYYFGAPSLAPPWLAQDREATAI